MKWQGEPCTDLVKEAPRQRQEQVQMACGREEFSLCEEQLRGLCD